MKTINQLYKEEKIISCCSVSYQLYKQGKQDTLDIKIDDIWIYNHKPPVKNYLYYSHTYSPKAMKKYFGMVDLK